MAQPEYEEIYLKAYASVAEAWVDLGAWLTFYNDERLHQALDNSSSKKDVYRRQEKR